MSNRKRELRILPVVLTALLVTGTLTLAQKKDSPDVLLQRAIQKEMVDGDLKAAIELYKKVVTSPGVTSRVAADALVHLGEAYERSGDAEARKAYEQVIREYANQTEAVAQAKRRLSSVGNFESTTGVQARLICPACGDTEASIAANGRLMAHTYWDNGDIAIRDLATGQITRLLAKAESFKDSEAYAESPLLSPDLRFVVYAWSPTKNGRAQLRVMPREVGAKPIVLLENPEFDYFEPRAWSLDGKSVLVTIQKVDKTWQLAWISVSDHSVKILKSLEWRGNPHAVLSPDGRYIAYHALAKNPSKAPPAEPDSTDRHIYVLPAKPDGSQVESELVSGASQNEAPVWTPDGKHILFVSNRYSGNYSLWSVAVEDGRATGGPRMVRPDTGRIRAISMAESGSFYYLQRQSGIDEVFIGNVPRIGTPPSPFGESTLGSQNPRWSPDGKFVAFPRRRGATGNRYDVVVRTVETGEERIYSHDGYASGYELIWFRDNRSFLAWAGEQPASPANNNRVLYRVDVDSKQWQPLLTLDITALAPPTAISPDEQTLYKGARDPKTPQSYPNNRPFDRILVLDFKTGQQKKVLTLPESVYTFRLSPDGRTFLLFSQPDPKTERFYLSRMALDGSEYHRLGPVSTVGTGVWTKDSRAFLFGEPIDGGSTANATFRIMRIPAEGGKAEFTGLTVPRLNGFDLNPDGSRIVFATTANSPSIELWVLDNINSLLNDLR
jgi:Tol biopolymer transport system component